MKSINNEYDRCIDLLFATISTMNRLSLHCYLDCIKRRKNMLKILYKEIFPKKEANNQYHSVVYCT